MRPVSNIALAGAVALCGAHFGCTSSSDTTGSTTATTGSATTDITTGSTTASTGSGGGGEGGAGGAAVTYTVLVHRTLKGDEASSKSLHESFVGAAKAKAQAGGDVGHDTFLDKDAPAEAPLDFLSIDHWNDLAGLEAFTSDPSVQGFLGSFYTAAPDVSVWQPEQGFTTWGAETDAGSTGAYVITLRGHHAGDEATALATHNAIVAAVPAPGAVALGNVAHLIFSNPKDETEILIVEVWTNQMNQEGIYGDPNFQMQIAKLWSGMPTITRWNETDWTRW